METADNTYNGWKNYATWRVNLEVFSESDYEGTHEDEIGEHHVNGSTNDLAQELEDYVDLVLFNDEVGSGLVEGYARAFLADVDWYEIADHMVNDWASNTAA